MDEEIVRFTPDLAADESTAFGEKVEQTTLREDPQAGAETMLVRLPPGGKIAAHSHRGPVQHFVLRGTYESAGKTFPAGTYRLLPGRADVPEIASHDGALILMVLDPVHSL